MFQLRTELDVGTSVVVHNSPDQPWGYIGWFRGSDGFIIDYPEGGLIGTLQSLGLLTIEDVVLKN
jgi:hypothetical protein